MARYTVCDLCGMELMDSFVNEAHLCACRTEKLVLRSQDLTLDLCVHCYQGLYKELTMKAKSGNYLFRSKNNGIRQQETQND